MADELDAILMKLDEIEGKIDQIKKATITREIRDRLIKTSEIIEKLEYKEHMKECIPRQMKGENKGDFKSALQSCVKEYKEQKKCDKTPMEDKDVEEQFEHENRG